MDSFLEEPGFYKACCRCRHLLHLSSLEFGWRECTGAFAFTWHFPLPLYTHRIMSGSLQAQDMFGTFTLCFPCLAEIPQHPRKSIISLCKGPAPSCSPALVRSCAVHGEWAAHRSTRPTHSMSYLISEWAQPPPCSCLVMKTLHSAS